MALSADELKEFAENERQAIARADRGGARPGYELLHVVIFTAVGVFMLLDVFAAITLPDRESAFWPVISLTVLSAGGAGAVHWYREKAWYRRWAEAWEEISEQQRRQR